MQFWSECNWDKIVGNFGISECNRDGLSAIEIKLYATLV